ncbi:MAG: thiamine phosphate synthase, partial [Chitinophagaceae bacterium]
GGAEVAEAGADYAGFGPFSTSTTKPNTHPLISLEDYINACANLVTMGLKMPVIAVGGITASDVPELLQTGVYGVAISAAINRAPDLDVAFSEFRSALS